MIKDRPEEGLALVHGTCTILIHLVSASLLCNEMPLGLRWFLISFLRGKPSAHLSNN